MSTQYPAFSLWNKDAPAMAVINPEDLRIKQSLRRLGLSSENPLVHPTSDGNEIKRRQNLLRFLSTKNRSEFRDYILDPGNELMHAKLPSEEK